MAKCIESRKFHEYRQHYSGGIQEWPSKASGYFYCIYCLKFKKATPLPEKSKDNE